MFQAVKLLLQFPQINYNLRNKQGDTCFEIAIQKRHPYLLNLLLRRVAELETSS